MVKTLWQLITKSLTLDKDFISLSPISAQQKISFLITKYSLYFQQIVNPFIFGKSYVIYQNRKLYYNFSTVGLVSLQRILTYQGNLFRQIKDEIKTIIDVGANVGFFSIVSQQLLHPQTIYACEPIQETFEVLEKNTSAYSQIHPFCIALSDKQTQLTMDYDGQNTEISHVSENGNQKVNAATLDQFVQQQNISQIDLLKIDAELHELHVLQGAKNTLANTKYLYIEINIENNDQYTVSELLSTLYSENYNFQLLGIHIHQSTKNSVVPTIEVLLQNKI